MASILLALALIPGCSLPFQNEMNQMDIGREIKMLDMHRTTLDWLPEYDPYSLKTMQVDLRGYDLTRLDVHDRYYDLIHADFDTVTKWPYWLPDNFDPKKILNNGKNPGLGIKSLHDMGINGKGVGVAIIDDVLLPDHAEYQQALKLYEEISCFDREASISGCRQASILVGKSTGLAPEADLYYIAEYCEFNQESDFSASQPISSPVDQASVYEPLISAINRILEINRGLGDENKIRVICIGQDIPKNYSGYFRVEQAVKMAENAGIFVISTSLYETSGYEMDFNGLGRNPFKDPDDPAQYLPGHNWEYDLYTFGRYVHTVEGLLVPMDSRTAAAPTGKKQYAYYSESDRSLCIPFIGGLYALACQVNPTITPDLFWEMALKTGDTIKVERNNITFTYKKVVNPVKLIEEIKGNQTKK